MGFFVFVFFLFVFKKKVWSKPYRNPLSIKDCISLQKSLSATSMHYNPGESHGIVASVTASSFAKIL